MSDCNIIHIIQSNEFYVRVLFIHCMCNALAMLDAHFIMALKMLFVGTCITWKLDKQAIVGLLVWRCPICYASNGVYILLSSHLLFSYTVALWTVVTGEN